MASAYVFLFGCLEKKKIKIVWGKKQKNNITGCKDRTTAPLAIFSF